MRHATITLIIGVLLTMLFIGCTNTLVDRNQTTPIIDENKPVPDSNDTNSQDENTANPTVEDNNTFIEIDNWIGGQTQEAFLRFITNDSGKEEQWLEINRRNRRGEDANWDWHYFGKVSSDFEVDGWIQQIDSASFPFTNPNEITCSQPDYPICGAPLTGTSQLVIKLEKKPLMVIRNPDACRILSYPTLSEPIKEIKRYLYAEVKKAEILDNHGSPFFEHYNRTDQHEEYWT